MNGPRQPGPGARIDAMGTIAIAVVIVPVLLLLLGRIGQLQIAPSAMLKAQLSERSGLIPEPGYRGEIVDSRGRVLSKTSEGRRLFVDPWRLRTLSFVELDRTLGMLSRVTGEPWEQLAAKVYELLDDNRARELRGAIRGDGQGARRYLSVGEVLPEPVIEGVLAMKIPGVHAERRPVRETPGSELVGPLVGLVGYEHKGLSGVEYAHNRKLHGQDGSLRFVRDAGGRPLWVHEGDWRPATHGGSVRLTIDLELQRIAMQELARGIDDAGAAGGRIVIVDPRSGDVLAMGDIVREIPGLAEFMWDDPAQGIVIPEPLPGLAPRYRTLEAPDPDLPVERNRSAQDMYEPGSTFKPFVWSAVSAMGLARRDEVFETGGRRGWRTPYGRLINDVSDRTSMSWEEVLVRSSNIGMAQGAARMTHDDLHSLVTSLGFGRRTGVALGGEAPGLVTPLQRWSKYTQTSVSFGHEIAVTPLQMVRAFCIYARDGERAGTLPTLRLVADAGEAPGIWRRVLPEWIALDTRRVLGEVARNMEAVMRTTTGEKDWMYRIFGKSGTAQIPLGAAPEGMRRPAWTKGYFPAQYNSSFVAAGPMVGPRLVVIVVIDDPAPELVKAKRHYGSWVAGPVARRVLESGLAYLGAPPDNIDRR